ncbi:MAG: hypothetical protein MJA29_11520 [Candidatus Omnitrophica bacterium]|nr:hypothetical protein [Candidatus Omnitrophota bacterium]
MSDDKIEVTSTRHPWEDLSDGEKRFKIARMLYAAEQEIKSLKRDQLKIIEFAAAWAYDHISEVPECLVDMGLYYRTSTEFRYQFNWDRLKQLKAEV